MDDLHTAMGQRVRRRGGRGCGGAVTRRELGEGKLAEGVGIGWIKGDGSLQKRKGRGSVLLHDVHAAKVQITGGVLRIGVNGLLEVHARFVRLAGTEAD